MRPLLFALALLALTPQAHAIYAPDSQGNPVWFDLDGTPEPSEGPDWRDSGGNPAWLAEYYAYYNGLPSNPSLPDTGRVPDPVFDPPAPQPAEAQPNNPTLVEQSMLTRLNQLDSNGDGLMEMPSISDPTFEEQNIINMLNEIKVMDPALINYIESWNNGCKTLAVLELVRQGVVKFDNSPGDSGMSAPMSGPDFFGDDLPADPDPASWDPAMSAPFGDFGSMNWDDWNSGTDPMQGSNPQDNPNPDNPFQPDPTQDDSPTDPTPTDPSTSDTPTADPAADPTPPQPLSPEDAYALADQVLNEGSTLTDEEWQQMGKYLLDNGYPADEHAFDGLTNEEKAQKLDELLNPTKPELGVSGELINGNQPGSNGGTIIVPINPPPDQTPPPSAPRPEQQPSLWDQAAEYTGELLAGGLNGINKAADTLGTQVSELAGLPGKIVDGVVNLTDAVVTIYNENGIVDGTKELFDSTVDGISTGVHNDAKIIQNVVDATGRFVDATGGFIDNVNTVVDDIGWDGLRSVMGDGVMKGLSEPRNLGENIGEALTYTVAGEAFGGAVGGIMRAGSEFAAGAAEAGEATSAGTRAAEELADTGSARPRAPTAEPEAPTGGPKVEPTVEPGPPAIEEPELPVSERKPINSPEAKAHEQAVTDSLKQQYGEENVGEQIMLEVTNTQTGEAVRIRPDALIKNPDGSFTIADAKYSGGDLTEGNGIRNAATENQRPAFDWITNGEAEIKPVGVMQKHSIRIS